MIEIITGSIIDSKEKYIAHQTNCVSILAAGVADTIFTTYPYSNTYANRTEHDIPGTIKILGNGIDQRFVINMFAQFYPGSSKYNDSNKDGLAARKRYFHQCLLRVAKISDLNSIAFPWRVGCGIAGGSWDHYLGTITNFANYVDEQHGARVVIYKREGDE